MVWMLLVLGPHVGYHGIRAPGSIWLSLTPGVEEESRREGAVFDRAKARKRRNNSSLFIYCPEFVGLGAVISYKIEHSY